MPCNQGVYVQGHLLIKKNRLVHADSHDRDKKNKWPRKIPSEYGDVAFATPWHSGGKSSSLSRFRLASEERLPNCAHCHPELMNGRSHPHHRHWQIAESGGRNKKEDHHKRCKLTAHPDTASLSLDLENMSVDHAATRIELATQPNACLCQHLTCLL